MLCGPVDAWPPLSLSPFAIHHLHFFPVVTAFNSTIETDHITPSRHCSFWKPLASYRALRKTQSLMPTADEPFQKIHSPGAHEQIREPHQKASNYQQSDQSCKIQPVFLLRVFLLRISSPEIREMKSHVRIGPERRRISG